MKFFHYFFSITLFLILLFFIISPNSIITATKDSATLFVNAIFPSLFPFLLLSTLVQNSAIIAFFNKFLHKIMKPIFNLPGVSSIALFLGMVGGYPIGAKTTADLVENKFISKNDAKKLIAFANNSGPLFILGAVGTIMYKNKYIGILLLLSHYIAALVVGFLFRFYKNTPKIYSETSTIQIDFIKISDLSKVLTDAIKKAIMTISIIGGFIIIFGIITTILTEIKIFFVISKILFPTIEPELCTAIFTGILEVTNGISKISSLNILSLSNKLILTSILLGFGGISVHMQTLSIINKVGLSSSTYFIGKSMQGIFSGLITFLLIRYTNFSYLIYESAFATYARYSYGFNKLISTIILCFLFIVVFKILQIFIEVKKGDY